MANMFVIDGAQLEQLREALNSRGNSLYKFRISVHGEHITYKVNEGGWTPPVGRVQEPY